MISASRARLVIPVVHMVCLLSSCGTTGSVVERHAGTTPPSGQLSTLDLGLVRNGPTAEVDVSSLLAYVRMAASTVSGGTKARAQARGRYLGPRI